MDPPEVSDSITFDAGSYRDRTGRVLRDGARIYRLLDQSGEQTWNALRRSNFFSRALHDGLIVPTSEIPDFPLSRIPGEPRWTVALEHERIPFISYPYEWSWSMLRDAALLHLEILLRAIDEQIITKDGSAYNVQWQGLSPTFIDVGSFELWTEGKPWAGYRQFCQTFLFPLMISSHKRLPFQPWLRGALDGIEVRQIAGLFGWCDLFKPGVMVDVWLHHQLQLASENKRAVTSSKTAPSLNAAMIRNNLLRLQKIVRKLSPPKFRSHWTGYAAKNTYSQEDNRLKREFVQRIASGRTRQMTWDLGCNTGEFSRILAPTSKLVVAFDADLPSVELLYRELKREGTANILPLALNLADPSPNQGWLGTERNNLVNRGKPELALALALIHHLVIGANLPMTDVVDWFASLGAELVIEFVDRPDPMVRELLKHKLDNYHDYNRPLFESLLAARFRILEQLETHAGNRILYHCLPLNHNAS